MRRLSLETAATGVVRALLILTAVFLIAPALLVFVLSFSGESFIRFPPQDWGLRQYETLFTDDKWLDAIWMSVKLAVPTAVLSVAIGLPAAFAMRRTRLPYRDLVQFLSLSSLLIPISAFGVALFGVFSELGLTATFRGMVLAHTVLAVPLVIVVLTTALARIPPELELIAMTLGASRLRAAFGITLRLLAPAIATAALFAFITSFDEAVLITFLGGPGLVTVPKAIFDSVRFGVDAVITAIAALTFVISAAIALVSVRLNPRSG